MNLKSVKLAKPVTITNALEAVGFIKQGGTQCRFISVLTETEVELLKSSPYQGVRKVSRRIGMINVNYVAGVEKRRAAAMGIPVSEVEYKPGKTWYYHDQTEDGKPLPIVRHSKTHIPYLQYFPLRSFGTRYLLPNGDEIPEDTLKPYFKSRGWVDDTKPRVCVFKMESLKSIRVYGVEFKTPKAQQLQDTLSS